MSTFGLVSLGLRGDRAGRQPATETEAAVFRRMLGEAFSIVADAIEAADAGPADVTVAVDACRAGVAAGMAAAALDPLAAACFASAREFAAQARRRATQQRAQVAALVAMVQEAVAAIAGSQTSLHETLTSSAERFERLTHIDNVQEIQAQLFDEVATLKRIAIERRSSWDQTFQDFGNAPDRSRRRSWTARAAKRRSIR